MPEAATALEDKEGRFLWGEAMLAGFFLAAGSAVFAGLLYLGKRAYQSQKNGRRDEDEDE